jgi:putative colanic acid biosynthesis acetyltransferase WcaF
MKRDDIEAKTQNLSEFKLPAGFRGRSAVVVQLWWLVQATLFRASPQFMYAWRNALLRLFGARVGRNVLIRPTARIVYPWKLTIGDNSWVGDFAELYTLGPILIGRNAVVSQHAYLCTGSHDIRSRAFDITATQITVEDEAWVAAAAFIHPGVTIARGSVVAARSIIRSNTEPHGIYAGDPARRVGTRD